jgi:hypothetical protein
VWYTTDITRSSSFEPVQPNPLFPTWSWAHRNLPLSTLVFGHPTGALSVAPTFKFNLKSEERRSRPGNTVSFCAITLNGFVQRVAERAIFQDSRPIKRASGHTKYPALPGSDSHWFFDRDPLAPGPYYCLRVLETIPNDYSENGTESCTESERDDTPLIIYYLVLRKAETITISGLRNPYIRVGILMLYEVSPRNLLVHIQTYSARTENHYSQMENGWMLL